MNRYRLPIIAISLLVLLRLAIGWQLFYEGIWKLQTLRTPTPWTSAGYLKNSQGPMRSTFRAMAGDADDLDWLNVDKVSKRWKDWQARFVRHYRLDKRQENRLKALIEGPQAYYSDANKLPSVPEDVDLAKVFTKDRDKAQVVIYDAERKRLKVDGTKHISPEEYNRLLKMLPQPTEGQGEREEVTKFRDELKKVYLRSSRLSFLERLKAALQGNPDVAGVMRDGKRDQMGELEKYREMIKSYEASLSAADQPFEHAHLQKLWSELQGQRSKIVGPIRALDAKLHEDAEGLLTVSQLARGGVPQPWTSLRIADFLTIVGLTVLGFCLLTGFSTRFSALMAAIMLFSFYLAMPPLPWLPDPPGTEHSLFINKNLIEVFALLALATLPTGYWFGIDALITNFICRWQSRRRSLRSPKPVAST